jgi:hypothetical protein
VCVVGFSSQDPGGHPNLSVGRVEKREYFTI